MVPAIVPSHQCYMAHTCEYRGLRSHHRQCYAKAIKTTVVYFSCRISSRLCSFWHSESILSRTEHQSEYMDTDSLASMCTLVCNSWCHGYHYGPDCPGGTWLSFLKFFLPPDPQLHVIDLLQGLNSSEFCFLFFVIDCTLITLLKRLKNFLTQLIK